jgi:hypothetical protein
VVTGNCWDHRENLSKLKDADFQQLTINLFYLIIIAWISIEKNSVFRMQNSGRRWDQKK